MNTPFEVGQWVLVRTYGAGVHVGRFRSMEEHAVVLTEDDGLRLRRRLRGRERQRLRATAAGYGYGSGFGEGSGFSFGDGEGDVARKPTWLYIVGTRDEL